MPVESPLESRPAPFRAGPVLLLSACHFIHDLYTAFLAPLLPLLIDKLSMTLTQAGFLSTVMQIPALLNPLIGNLADRISVRWFVVAAPIITAVSMSLIGLAPSYGVLLVLLLVAGVSTSMFHVPAPVMVTRMAGNRTGKGMSFFMTGGELARTVGPLAAVGAVSLWGLEGFYPVMAVGVAASSWLWFQLRNMPMATNGRFSKTASRAGVWRSMKHILGPLAGILFARGFMHASVVTFLPTFWGCASPTCSAPGWGFWPYPLSENCQRLKADPAKVKLDTGDPWHRGIRETDSSGLNWLRLIKTSFINRHKGVVIV